MKKWLQEATSSQNVRNLSKKEPFSTRRNSKEVLMAWRKSRSYDDIAEVQKRCKYAMNVLGFNLVDNEQQLHDTEKFSLF